MYHTNPKVIRKALKMLKNWCLSNGMLVNTDKTKMMIFRSAGPLKKVDIFMYNEKQLEIVNTFSYLGVTLQTSGTTFSKHIEKRFAQTITILHAFTDIHLLSLDNALKLFYMKFTPIIEYSIRVIWPYLTMKNLQNIDRILSEYLKRVCQVSTYTKNRIILTICDTPTLANKIKAKYQLEATIEYQKYLKRHCEKMDNIDRDLFLSPAMTQSKWKNSMQENRHVVTRHAAHGYHHLICQNNKEYHMAEDACICKLCNLPARQYHLLNCKANDRSLQYYSTIYNKH